MPCLIIGLWCYLRNVGFIEIAVESGSWTPERAWKHIERMQDDRQITHAIPLLYPYLTKSHAKLAFKKIYRSTDQPLYYSALLKIFPYEMSILENDNDIRKSVQSNELDDKTLIKILQKDPTFFC
jgi:hypothetical protein